MSFSHIYMSLPAVTSTYLGISARAIEDDTGIYHPRTDQHFQFNEMQVHFSQRQHYATSG